MRFTESTPWSRIHVFQDKEEGKCESSCNSFPNIVIVRAIFAVVGGPGAVKLWRSLTVTN
jgi:hypothetical protein